MNPRMIEALIGVGTVVILFVPVFLNIAVATARRPNVREARLRELKKYSIPPLNLR
jgi:hypothetical protein